MKFLLVLASLAFFINISSDYWNTILINSWNDLITEYITYITYTIQNTLPITYTIFYIIKNQSIIIHLDLPHETKSLFPHFIVCCFLFFRITFISFRSILTYINLFALICNIFLEKATTCCFQNVRNERILERESGWERRK